MSFDHKAYAFDWLAFESELLPLLIAALDSSEVSELIAFIEANRDSLSDPYEGGSLGSAWESTLTNRDVHEYADHALTKYYDPSSNAGGLTHNWSALSDQLPPSAARALLGDVVGPHDNPFDPGRMGSYFQTPDQVRQSWQILRAQAFPQLQPFIALLDQCQRMGLGLYITF